jgi:AhpD family alkylhydroperoxidase
MKDYIETTQEITAGMKELSKQIPGVLQGFGAMSKAAKEDNALDYKTKELIALALGVAARCDGCIGFHMEEVVKHGATKQEICEALGVAIFMGGGPTLMYAAEAMEAYEQIANKA